MTTSSPPRQFGLWISVALVVGNMVGSGIFLLPASLAPYGLTSVLAWLLTAAGAICLAIVFSALSRAFPAADGPYEYTRIAFGDLTAFVVAWGYWVALWVGNAAIATAAVSYLSDFAPWISQVPGASALTTVFFVWVFTAINVLGARSAGGVQVVTTILKILPLLLVSGLGIYLVLTKDSRLLWSEGTVPLSVNAVTAAATLTLWALLGMESSAVASDRIIDPARNIPRATLIGTVLTALVYILSCTAVLMVIPAGDLAQSRAPFADVARMFWGPAAGHWVALFAVISALGALNGWILLHGEVPSQMARSGLFPAIFARQSSRQTPAFALCISSVLVTILVLMNYRSSMAQVFTFMILLSTTAALVLYLVCALAVLKLMRSGQLNASGGYTGSLAVVAVLASVYSLWTLIGAGKEAVIWGFVLLAIGVPVHFVMRGRRNAIDNP